MDNIIDEQTLRSFSFAFNNIKTEQTNIHQILGCQTFSFSLFPFSTLKFVKGKKTETQKIMLNEVNKSILLMEVSSALTTRRGSRDSRGKNILISFSTFLNLRFWIMFSSSLRNFFLYTSNTFIFFIILFSLRYFFDQKKCLKDSCLLGLSQCLFQIKTRFNSI